MNWLPFPTYLGSNGNLVMRVFPSFKFLAIASYESKVTFLPLLIGLGFCNPIKNMVRCDVKNFNRFLKYRNQQKISNVDEI